MADVAHMGYLKGVGIALTQLANALIKGWPDETLCSRSYRWRVAGKRTWPETVLNSIFFLDKEEGKFFCEDRRQWIAYTKRHCEMSYESERKDRHLPPEMRGNA